VGSKPHGLFSSGCKAAQKDAEFVIRLGKPVRGDEGIHPKRNELNFIDLKRRKS